MEMISLAPLAITNERYPHCPKAFFWNMPSDKLALPLVLLLTSTLERAFPVAPRSNRWLQSSPPVLVGEAVGRSGRVGSGSRVGLGSGVGLGTGVSVAVGIAACVIAIIVLAAATAEACIWAASTVGVAGAQAALSVRANPEGTNKKGFIL